MNVALFLSLMILLALLAAAGTAVYPYLIFYSVVGLTESLFIALMIAAYICW